MTSGYGSVIGSSSPLTGLVLQGLKCRSFSESFGLEIPGDFASQNRRKYANLLNVGNVASLQNSAYLVAEFKLRENRIVFYF